MLTVADIAAMAFSAVGGAIGGVIKPATLQRTVLGAYNASTGQYATTLVTLNCRAVFDTAKPVRDVFPAYVAGPGEKLAYLEGLQGAARENDKLLADGKTYTVKQAADVAEAGGLYAVMVV